MDMPLVILNRRRRGGGISPLVLFAAWPWFLKSGVWDSLGQWVDEVAWTPNWFLATGIINVYGAWADSEAWA